MFKKGKNNTILIKNTIKKFNDQPNKKIQIMVAVIEF